MSTRRPSTLLGLAWISALAWACGNGGNAAGSAASSAHGGGTPAGSSGTASHAGVGGSAAATTGTGGGAAGCPAYPAVPDASCTGYKHTGVTLHPCSGPLEGGQTYDSCIFTGEVNVSGANAAVTRSLIQGAVVYRTVDDGSLRGLSLTDVEIDSSGQLGGASIGNNDYTCVRCDVHGGTRGANVGNGVTIQDSYLHDWTYTAGDHQTGIGSNGGAHNRILHNWIVCSDVNDPTSYGCSSAFSIYGDDSPGNDDWTVSHNRFDSGSSYCVVVAGPPSKPYPYTNIQFVDNTFGDLFAAYWKVPAHACTQYGPISGWMSDASAGNVWSGNVDVNGVAE
jgi:hypothetical protein